MSEPAPDLAFVRGCLRRASRSPDPMARAEARRALAELAPDLGTPLVDCPHCGATGLPERVLETDCPHVER
jgi:hypothetical protein